MDKTKVTEAFIKEAFSPGIKRVLTLGAAQALAMVGTVGLMRTIDGIISYLEKAGQKVASKKYYQNILEAHPQLQKEDPVTLAKYWESLNHFAPHMAKDPLASGAYITQSLKRLSSEEFGGPPPETIATLSDIENKLRNKDKKLVNSSDLSNSYLKSIGDVLKDETDLI